MMNILAVTGSRSEYDLLFPLIKKLDNEKKITFHLFCCGSHVDKNFGNTINEIKKDKFSNVYTFKTIKKYNSKNIEILNSHKELSSKISKFLVKQKINVLILLGDRFEAHASALAAYFLKVPIVHISGGDTSLGSMDEFFRNSISLMSDMHFVKTKKHQLKLIKLGVEKKKIFITGSLSNENYKDKFYNGNIFRKPFGLVTFHPVTSIENKDDNNTAYLFNAVKNFKNLNFFLQKVIMIKVYQK